MKYYKLFWISLIVLLFPAIAISALKASVSCPEFPVNVSITIGGQRGIPRDPQFGFLEERWSVFPPKGEKMVVPRVTYVPAKGDTFKYILLQIQESSTKADLLMCKGVLFKAAEKREIPLEITAYVDRDWSCERKGDGFVCKKKEEVKK